MFEDGQVELSIAMALSAAEKLEERYSSSASHSFCWRLVQCDWGFLLKKRARDFRKYSHGRRCFEITWKLDTESSSTVTSPISSSEYGGKGKDNKQEYIWVYLGNHNRWGIWLSYQLRSIVTRDAWAASYEVLRTYWLISRAIFWNDANKNRCFGWITLNFKSSSLISVWNVDLCHAHVRNASPYLLFCRFVGTHCLEIQTSLYPNIYSTPCMLSPYASS